jgi:hypothetical protein
VRLEDLSGTIDIKFWNSCADAYREHEGLKRGTIIEIKGFRVVNMRDERPKRLKVISS